MKSFLAYSEFAQLWKEFTPFTPFGKDYQQNCPIICESNRLESIWNHTEKVMEFLEDKKDSPISLDRIKYHLKRLPRITENIREFYDEGELFEYKKFLYNSKLLLEILPENIKENFSLNYTFAPLEQVLSVGQQSAETFFLASEYSPKLQQIREEISQIDSKINNLRKEADRQLAEKFSISFGDKEFLVIERERIADFELASQYFNIEPFDEISYLIRPYRKAQLISLHSLRENLALMERNEESTVLGHIAEEIRKELPNLLTFKDCICTFDLSLARACLSQQFQMTRPIITEIERENTDENSKFVPIKAVKARFLPCQNTCLKLNTSYQPLDVEISTPCTVLFGSNMGGKTIVLKTLAFLQLCVQTGLFVPAEQFTTKIFHNFHYIGEGQDKGQTNMGLSGFGYEMYQFTSAWKSFNQSSFVLFDEFARTTHSSEAEALITAILAELADKCCVTSIFSTHFKGIKRLAGVSYLRMKGLNREILAKYLSDNDNNCEKQSANCLDSSQCAKLIDKLMDYSILKAENTSIPSDALTIAKLLGVDSRIIERATVEFTGETEQKIDSTIKINSK